MTKKAIKECSAFLHKLLPTHKELEIMAEKLANEYTFDKTDPVHDDIKYDSLKGMNAVLHFIKDKGMIK